MTCRVAALLGGLTPIIPMMRAGIVDPCDRLAGQIAAGGCVAIELRMRTLLEGGCKVMLRIAAAVIGLMLLMGAGEAPAEPNYAVWLMAHERMVAKWRRAEPRCGW